MPRTRYDRLPVKAVTVPPPNYVRELMQRYAKAQQLRSEDMGAALGISGAAVRHALSRPADAWTLAELKKYSAVLNIPIETALAAAQRSMEGRA